MRISKLITLSQRYYRATVCGSGWFAPIITLVVVGFFLYFHTIFFDYVYLDDTLLVEKSSEFLRDIRNVPNAFTQEVFTSAQQGDGIFYRPVLTVSFLLDTSMFGGSLIGYRLTNIVLHVFSSILIFVLLCTLRYSMQTSFFFSLFFTVHPLFTQAVAWIPGRNDTLLALFVFTSFIFFLHGLERVGHAAGPTLFFLGHLLFFALALFTKETALVLPVLLLVYRGYVHRRHRERPEGAWHVEILRNFQCKRSRPNYLVPTGLLRHFVPRNDVILIVGWVIISCVFLYFRATFINNPNSYSPGDALHNILMQFPGILVYLGKIFFPLKLSVYPELSDSAFIPGIIAVIFLSFGLMIAKNKRWSIVTFGIIWFLLFLLPTFGIREKYSSGILREHRVYIPMVGILLILAESVISFPLSVFRLKFIGSQFSRLINRKLITSLIIVTLLLILFLRTYLHSLNFRDSLSFWQNAVETSPSSPVASLNLGASYARINNWDEAERYYQKALLLAPNLSGVHNNLGVVYMKKGQMKDAKAEFEKELARDPSFEMAKRNLELIRHIK